MDGTEVEKWTQQHSRELNNCVWHRWMEKIVVKDRTKKQVLCEYWMMTIWLNDIKIVISVYHQW